MKIDNETQKRLNLLLRSPEFVINEIGEVGDDRLLMCDTIPDSTGVYWIAGQTMLKSGQKIPSVFRVDTDSGGELLSVFWFVGDVWFSPADDGVYPRLHTTKREVHPFDWTLAVKLERDIFHS